MRIGDNFLGLEDKYSSFSRSKICILKVPYEGTVSYGKGTSKGPAAMIDASKNLELYDEVLDKEVYGEGISTIDVGKLAEKPEDVVDVVYKKTKELLDQKKYIVLLGGEHSVSFGYFKALKEKYPKLSVVQLDAHADLRDKFGGSNFSHGCVMSRIREKCDDVVQVGIRSLSVEEAELINRKNYDVFFAHDIVDNTDFIQKLLKKIKNDDVFVTIDVDFFSWDVVNSTGTPEPGGIGWYQSLDILKEIFKNKNVVGFDVVELCSERNSAFAMAKLVYRLIGYRF